MSAGRCRAVDVVKQEVKGEGAPPARGLEAHDVRQKGGQVLTRWHEDALGKSRAKFCHELKCASTRVVASARTRSLSVLP